MRYKALYTALTASALMATAFITGEKQNQTEQVNPLLQNWTGPYGGIPPFDKVNVADFKPALETAMAEQHVELN